MEEESHFVRGFVTAHVTGEWVVVAVVTHMHGIHNHVFESHVTKLALMGTLPGLLGILCSAMLRYGHEWGHAALTHLTLAFFIFPTHVFVMFAALAFSTFAKSQSDTL